MAALLIAYSASPVHAALDSCTTIGDTTTCTFVPSGSEDTFEVPEGVSSIHVVATGAPGAEGLDVGPSGGLGAQVSGDLTVTPGQTLYVNVGGAPTNVAGICGGSLTCGGGFNGGGSSRNGGGGGGASDVRTVATPSSGDQSASLNSRLIVAGGGGGRGATFPQCPFNPSSSGGAGGDAGSNGDDSDPCGTLAGGTGGKAGSLSAGGAGGSGTFGDGQSGSLGRGGNGGGGTGGGGGGGYYGGGGGGSWTRGGPEVYPASAGGGGGGSNLVPIGGKAVSATGSPSVTIRYTPNHPPVAQDDPVTTAEDTPINIAVLSNDTDIDGDTLSVSNIDATSAQGGSVSKNADGTLKYTPAANYNGTDSFTYTVSEGNGGTDTATVDVTVTPVNDAPSFTSGDDQTVNVNAGAQSVSPWATDISAGPEDESGQEVSFETTNTNNALFSVQPSVASNGTLTYTPAPNASGSATVRVTLKDDGGTPGDATDDAESTVQTFTINVTAPTKGDCKKGGWRDFRFPDQGTCITFVNENLR
jgi:Bacterial Ig domain/Glycine rich protein